MVLISKMGNIPSKLPCKNKTPTDRQTPNGFGMEWSPRIEKD